MKTRTKTQFLTIGLVTALTIFVICAFAQQRGAGTMDTVREKIGIDKKMFVADLMKLTDTEADAFWPVYTDYQLELNNINNRDTELTNNFANNCMTMTDDAAKKLTDDFLSIQEDRLELMKNYLSRFRQALPEKKVMRYFQIENKIRAVVDYGTAAEIPLAY